MQKIKKAIGDLLYLNLFTDVDPDISYKKKAKEYL